MILHTDNQRVVIATGLDRPSSNRKTGDMTQVWILHRTTHPVVAVQTGEDVSICGHCPLRRDPSTGRRSCYVTVSQAPAQIWKTYVAGKYPVWDGHDVDMFRFRPIRWGAYGDPVFIPYPIVRKLSAAARGWTGYTHQWRNPLYQSYRNYFMASADTPQDQADAVALGWRTFRVGDSPVDNTEILCPNASHGVSCAHCRLCGGLGKRGAKNIYIPAHGTSAKFHPSATASGSSEQ